MKTIRAFLLTCTAMLGFSSTVAPARAQYSEADIINAIIFLTTQKEGTYGDRSPAELTQEYLDHGRAACDPENFPIEDGVPFTAAEKELTRSIFGDEVNLENARKHFLSAAKGRGHPAGTCSIGDGTEVIAFFGEKNHSPDYSLEKNPKKFGDYNHETTHIFHVQNGINNNCNLYNYKLAAESDFMDYCTEQQASIIGDYSMLYLHPSHTLPQRISTRSPQMYEWLKQVVENRFPEAKKTRLAFEAKEQAAKLKPK